jgi:hypothetical protein
MELSFVVRTLIPNLYSRLPTADCRLPSPVAPAEKTA